MQDLGHAPWLSSASDRGEPNLSGSSSGSLSLPERLKLMRQLQNAELNQMHGPPGGPPYLDQPKKPQTYPFIVLAAAVTAFKFLLFPSYRSTDFEVHRNWLAITSSLPLSKWYYEKTSEWTLDYPPLFAWTERALAVFARFFDPGMLNVRNLNYASPNTVLFQRLSVVVLDVIYVYATFQGCLFLAQRTINFKSRTSYPPSTIYACLMLWNVGLLIVDHIHFQYNGFLLGFVLLAIIRIIEKRYFAAALWFSIALNLKHIFMYMAPPFGIFLLRQCCLPTLSWKAFSGKNFIILGSIFASVTAISLGPFIILGQLPQLLGRLFPFQRGLTHAYWAPNFWAIYNSFDKILSIIGPRLGLIDLVQNGTSVSASLTGGLVKEQNHMVLMDISPGMTLILTIFGMLPPLWYLWNAKTGDHFVRSLVASTLSSFLFGWHVHEKAILLVTVPYTWLAVNNAGDARLFLILITAGYYGLHPLLFTPAEIPLKYVFLLLYSYTAFKMFKDRFPARTVHRWALPLLSSLESAYILGFLIVEFYNCFVHSSILNLALRFPFVPLMITSLYSAMGIMYVYVQLLLLLRA